MRPKARNTTRNPALPRPARWRAAKSREAAVVLAPIPVDHGTPEAIGRLAMLQGVRRLPSRLARPITRRVSAAREPEVRTAPETKGAGWIRRFPSPVPGAKRAERTDRAAGDRSRGRMRLGRKSPAARPADWMPVRYRVARAVGAAASALPESRAVRVGTAVAELVAANQGVIKAGLTAASAVPVLRPYVKVAATAMGAIAVARRIARAKNAAADVAAAFRGPAAPGTAHAGNGFGLDPKALPEPAGGREAASAHAAGAGAAPTVPAQADSRDATTATGEGPLPAKDGDDSEEVGPSAALQSEPHRDAGAARASRAAGAGASTEQGREP
ncbi:hypothetical protein AB0K52_21235 [Glycomyces sp. NPDC049804]|uniref:hypothetical protein n=1 Tax=Glycomyces sp. NPDC049804 TaxID=3154363 RepID=UPI00343AA48D